MDFPAVSVVLQLILIVLLISYRPGDDGSIGGMNGSRLPDALSPHTCIKSSAEYELALILKEIRFITDQVSR